MNNIAINALLTEGELFVQNAQDDGPIEEAFAGIGRGADYFAKGEHLLKRAQDLHEKQQAEYGDKYAATETLGDERREAKNLYMRHLKFARIALAGDTEARSALGLGGDRERDLEDWMGQARTFYNNIATDERLQEALEAEVGLSREDVERAQEEVEDVARAFEAKMSEKGEAEESTKERNAAFDILEDWVNEGQALARVLMEERPQQLEKLGLVARSS